MLLWLLLSSFTHLFAQDSCVVKVFPGDCVNCYIGMSGVKSLQDNVKKTIVFPNLSKAEVNAYLKNVFNITDVDKYTIIVSDSIYEALDKNYSSEVYLYDENKLYNHSLLKKFSGENKPKTFEIKIPDSIAISLEITTVNNNDYIFITDSKFGNCLFVNKQDDHKINLVRAKDFTTRSNFYKLSGDTISYRLFLENKAILNQANLDRMRFSPTFGKNMMATYILAPVVREENGNRGFAYKTGIIIFKNPETYTIIGIDEESIPDGYVVYPGVFAKEKDDYYIQLANTDRNKDEQYLMGKFLLKNGRLEFSEYPAFKTPHEYLPATKFKYLRKVIVPSGSYFFLQYSLTYYNVNLNKTFQLPLDSVNLKFEFNSFSGQKPKFEYNFRFIDAFVSEKYFQVLYNKSNNYFIATIDKTSHKLVNNVEITNPEKKPIKSGLKFYSKKKLYYLTKDNTIVIESIKYK